MSCSKPCIGEAGRGKRGKVIWEAIDGAGLRDCRESGVALIWAPDGRFGGGETLLAAMLNGEGAR
jgi:hypothetical protein